MARSTGTSRGRTPRRGARPADPAVDETAPPAPSDADRRETTEAEGAPAGGAASTEVSGALPEGQPEADAPRPRTGRSADTGAGHTDDAGPARASDVADSDERSETEAMPPPTDAPQDPAMRDPETVDAASAPSATDTTAMAAPGTDTPALDPAATDAPDTGATAQTAEERAARPASAVPPEPRRGGFLPLLFGGVLAAGLGALAVLYLFPPESPEVGRELDRLRATVGQLERDLAAQGARQQEVGARLDELAAIAAEPAEDAARQGELSDLAARVDAADARFAAIDERLASAVPAAEAGLSDVRQRLDNLEERLAALPAEPTAGAVPDEVAARLAALEDRVAAAGPVPDDLRAETQALAARLAEIETARDEVAQALAAMRDGIAAAEARVDAAATEAAETAVAGVRDRLQAAEEVAAAAERTATEAAAAELRQAVLAAARARLSEALETGAPLAPALRDLADANIDVPAALTDHPDGLPTLQALQRSFPQAAREALAAARRAEVGADRPATDRLAAFLQAQLGVRSLAARDGDDADAVLSRAEAAVNAGDLTAAIGELETLNPEGRAAMTDWLAGAEARLAALDAVAALSAASPSP